MTSLNFDARSVAPDTGFDTVPKGWYNVMVDETDVVPTKKEGGTMLKARYVILDGQYAGRKLFSRFNIRNANPTAQEIGLKQLSALQHAIGMLVIQDTAQLHGIPLKVRVKIKEASGDYDDSNEITSWKNINEAVDGGAVVATPGVGAPAGFAQPGFQAAPAPQQFAPQPQFQQPAPVQPQFAAPVAQPQYQQPVAPVAQPQQYAPQPTQQWQAPVAPQPWTQPQAPVQQQLAPVAQPQVQQPAPAGPQSAPPPWVTPKQ